MRPIQQIWTLSYASYKAEHSEGNPDMVCKGWYGVICSILGAGQKPEAHNVGYVHCEVTVCGDRSIYQLVQFWELCSTQCCTKNLVNIIIFHRQCNNSQHPNTACQLYGSVSYIHRFRGSYQTQLLQKKNKEKTSGTITKSRRPAVCPIKLNYFIEK